MTSRMVLIMLAFSLVFSSAQGAAAGEIGYRMRSAATGFGDKPPSGPPGSAAMAADGLIGRPVGAAATAVGAAIFAATLPVSLLSRSTKDAAWGLVGRPAGWTLLRPLGRGRPKLQEEGVFRP